MELPDAMAKQKLNVPRFAHTMTKMCAFPTIGCEFEENVLIDAAIIIRNMKML
jgi:hypothetical protein